MIGVLVVAVVAGAVLLLVAADALVKARARARWRRQMQHRLGEVATRAAQQQQRRQAAARDSKALTSVMPAIKRPPLTPPGARPTDRS